MRSRGVVGLALLSNLRPRLVLTMRASCCPAALNPCEAVRRSCQRVVAGSRHVSIDSEAVSRLARDVVQRSDQVLRVCDWNTEWHFHREADPVLTTQYLFVLDALNFCFWPSPGFEYEDLARGLKRVVESNPQSLDADRLECLDTETLVEWFPAGALPNIEERTERLRELGAALTNSFDGKAYNLVKSCDRSAVQFVRRVLQELPGFRDTAVLDGRLVHFYKRAQILCGDIWAAFGRGNDPESCFSFLDIGELTMFADYRVPQLLHHLNVLKYEKDLEQQILSLSEIESGSRMEVKFIIHAVIPCNELH